MMSSSAAVGVSLPTETHDDRAETPVSQREQGAVRALQRRPTYRCHALCQSQFQHAVSVLLLVVREGTAGGSWDFILENNKINVKNNTDANICTICI